MSCVAASLRPTSEIRTDRLDGRGAEEDVVRASPRRAFLQVFLGHAGQRKLGRVDGPGAIVSNGRALNLKSGLRKYYQSLPQQTKARLAMQVIARNFKHFNSSAQTTCEAMGFWHSRAI